MLEIYRSNNQLNLIDRLDMKLSVSVAPGTEFSEMSQKFGIRGEVGFSFSKKLPEISLAFPNSAEQHLELRIFFQKFDAIEHGGVWRIRREVQKAIRELECIRSLLEVKSMVLVSAWLSDGRYHVELIFHHDDIGATSRVLLETVRDTDGLKIDYIGPSPGIKEILYSLDSRNSLSVFEIGLTPPEGETEPENNPCGDRWSRIGKMPFGAEKINAVYFFPDSVTGTNWLCQAVTSNAFVSYMNGKMNKARILALARIYEHNKPNFSITTILPKTMSQEFLSVVSESAIDMSDWKPVLRSIVGIKEWIKLQETLKE